MLLDKAEIVSWFNSSVASTMTDGEVTEAYQRQHPSKIFLRNLPLNSAVIDIGAGDGSLVIFKNWPSPPRPDLRLFAYSLEKGAHFDKFDGYEVGDWNDRKPAFGGMKFDAINCAHFIEHIQDPASLVHWAKERLVEGGRLYLEWPAKHSALCPAQSELAPIGFERITCNYHDDPTHLNRIPSRRAMLKELELAGFSIESVGTVSMPLIADELLALYRSSKDSIALQQAYWLKTNWCQYIVATFQPDMETTEGVMARTKATIKKALGLEPAPN